MSVSISTFIIRPLETPSAISFRIYRPLTGPQPPTYVLHRHNLHHLHHGVSRFHASLRRVCFGFFGVPDPMGVLHSQNAKDGEGCNDNHAEAGADSYPSFRSYARSLTR